MPDPSPYTDLATLTGNQNLLVLAPGPLDGSQACGGLIALTCRRGRPPFVMVLGDGVTAAVAPDVTPVAYPGASADSLARLYDHATRAGIRHLGLDEEYLLMAGLHSGQIPQSGPVFDTIVRAVTFVMWKQDCNVVCAPGPRDGSSPDEAATYRVALAVSVASGVGLLTWASEDPARPEAACRLDIASARHAKTEAIAAHRAVLAGAGIMLNPAPCDEEVFVRWVDVVPHVAR